MFGQAPRRAQADGGGGLTISRSEYRPQRPGTAVCGNCHGTGGENFNMIDGTPCDACNGRGFHKIDPNVKGISLKEFMEYQKEKRLGAGGEE